jgi:hypothetical protein
MKYNEMMIKWVNVHKSNKCLRSSWTIAKNVFVESRVC